MITPGNLYRHPDMRDVDMLILTASPEVEGICAQVLYYHRIGKFQVGHLDVVHIKAKDMSKWTVLSMDKTPPSAS